MTDERKIDGTTHAEKNANGDIEHKPNVLNTGSVNDRVFAGTVLRKTADGWETIASNDNNHTDFNIDSANVSADSNSITVPLDTSAFGEGTDADVNVLSNFAVGDEQFASSGIHVGASVTWDQLDIELYKLGVVDLITSDGSSFSDTFGFFPNVSWDSNDGVLIIDVSGQYGINTPPTIQVQTDVDSNYTAVINKVIRSSQIYEVAFVDYSGTQITSIDSNMSLWITDSGRGRQLDPTSDIPDNYGNIWVGGDWAVNQS